MEQKPWLAKWGLSLSGLLLCLIFSVQGFPQTARSTILTLGSPNLTGQPGKAVTLGMRFDAVPLRKNYRVFLHFVDSSGATVVNGDHSPSAPTSTWNGAIRYNRSVTLPSALKNGVFSIYAGLYDAASPLTRVALNMGTGVAADNSLRYKIGTLNVGSSIPAPQPTPAPSPAPAPVPTQATVNMLSNPNLTVAPGGSVTMGMRFNGVPMSANHTVFVHFVAANGTQYPGGDHAPAVSTSTWNGPVAYNHTRVVPTTMPAGTYSIRVGLYSGSNRYPLAVGSGVTADAETRYTVGTLTVGSGSTPAPAPQPAPAPAPVPAPAPNYTITISSPSAGATVSGSMALRGTALGMKNLEVMSSSGSMLARSTPDASGNFTATVDTTKLANGSQSLTVEAWNAAAGQSFTRTDKKTLAVNVQNSSSTPAPTPAPAPAPSTGGSSIPRPGSLTGLTASGPVTLQSNRTYSGLRVSNPNGRCFVGNNVTNVRITNSEIGPCGNGSDSEQLGIGIYDSSNVRVDHNIIHDVATGLDAVRSTGVVFSHNYVYGIRGPMPSGQAVQYENIRGRGNKILCNIIANSESAGTEDNVSLWMSNGDPADPIEIAYNRVRGGHSRTGSGIIVGDGNGSGNVDVHDNTVVNVNNAGIGIASGQNLKIRNNRIYNNGTYTSVGLSVRNWYDSCNNVQVTGNRVWAFDRVWNASPTEWHYLNNGTCSNVTESGNIFGDTSLSPAIFDEEYPQCNY